MDIWGFGTALIGVTCFVCGLALGYGWGAKEVKPKRSGWEAPGRCTWQEVERPAPEKTLAERQFDEIVGGDPWRDTP